ncbi:DNA polymerase II [Simiduia sp. 21SJ11W-1]|uniref:DNA polymerase II n=1 Tax=Simiduia sp. 21SJ11W-1 TaxID=2909669 RepID=UPI00209ECDA4|nr:DNA polymerase II [Simiduia sp. 21SJ11W-1]UTA47583.1 DNA polymerase II [Simiduia sp. 21SJ11W-1]
MIHKPPQALPSEQGFLLTRDWRDTRAGLALELWLHTAKGARALRITGLESVCFFAAEDEPQVARALTGLTGWRTQSLTLKTHAGTPVQGLYCREHRIQREAVQRLGEQGIRLWESDIRPADRFLMERFITADLAYTPGPQSRGFIAPKSLARAQACPLSLGVLSVDIETSLDGKQLFSIGMQGMGVRRVYMVGAQSAADEQLELVGASSERDCLDKFLRAVRLLDPDILIGWNFVSFDLWMLQKFCDNARLPFAIGRDGRAPRWREEGGESERRYVHIAGRVALDGIDLLKAAAHSFDSYGLNHVAGKVLGAAKLIEGNHRGEEILRLYREDKPSLAAYNLQDCQLVSDIFAKLKLLDFAVARARLTGLPLDRIGGSVAAFEYAYLPRLHRAGFVAPNLGEVQSDVISPGGLVMDSRPGVYQNVVVLDFKSLYPSIIRSFLIDPCGYWLARTEGFNPALHVQGFNDAYFVKQGHLLPGIIETLWAARDAAKQAQDQPLSHAIKIIMNSFYGVLGSEGCRFFDPRVCSSITLRGHEIIQRSRVWIEAQGFDVIYGDTDSVFVWVDAQRTERCPAEVGKSLAHSLNRWWADHLRDAHGVQSALEIEFETHFEQFFMPTIRGSEQGSKKRYAGIVRNSAGEQQLIFKGLESVRTDWTPLAREFQTALYWKLFNGEPYSEWVQAWVASLLAGERDEQLVYRKRLRRKLADYAKNRPPHVQAAIKLAARGDRPRRGDWVSYCITVNGPEPVCDTQGEPLALPAPMDYTHYLERQLQPVADAILPFFNSDFSALVDAQLNLW